MGKFNIKSIFFESAENKAEENNTSTTTEQIISKEQTVQPTNNISDISSPKNGVIEDKFAQHFDKLMADVNLLKPDYFDFKKAIINMNSIALDEPTKYKVAFATLTTQGLSKDKILESLNFYIQLISNDKDRFDTSVSDKIANDIATRNVQIKENEELIKQHAAQIDELSKKIAESNVLITQYKNEQKEITDKLDTKIANYSTTQAKYLSDLTNDITKINSYL